MFSNKFSFSPETVFVKSDEFVHRVNPNNTAILVRTSDDNDFFKISGVAFFIWQSMDGKMNLGQILEQMLNKFEVTPEQLYKDTEDFIEKLNTLKIITPKSE